MNPEQLEQFDKYYNNLLSISERESFERKLEINPEFKEQYRDYRSIRDGLKIQDLNDKFEFLRTLESKKNTKIFGLRRKIISIAASIIGLVAVAAILYLNQNRQPSNRALFVQNNFDHLMVHETARSSSSSGSQYYDEFILEDFDSAIPILEKRWESSSDTIALYYLGLSYIITQDPRADSIIFLDALDPIQNIDTIRGLSNE